MAESVWLGFSLVMASAAGLAVAVAMVILAVAMVRKPRRASGILRPPADDCPCDQDYPRPPMNHHPPRLYNGRGCGPDDDDAA